MERIRIEYKKLCAYMEEMLEKGLGYPKETAAIASQVLVEADARGHASHGVARIQLYHEQVEDGKGDSKGLPEIVYETPVSLVVQGNSGPGFAASKLAMEKAIEKARTSGTCMAVVRDSSHFGMAGVWAEMAADVGMMGIALTNTIKAGIPLFGKERLLGTNPICVAIPTGHKPHFMLDMATTTVALGKIEVAARRSGTMPEGWFVDENGKDTTDAVNALDISRSNRSPYGGQLFLGGAGEALGGHKGYGLGLLVELLTAGLSLGTPTFDAYADRCGICHYFQATRLDLFGDEEKIMHHVRYILEKLRVSPKAEGHDRIYIHGEKEFERRKKSMEEGIYLDPATWTLLDEYADKFGMPHVEP
ncbi:MAG: Ldh family oxidoreductase [Aminobacteriaceae bacterium]|jgi:LDH2 family malate/lactate/ureidoglycolate dehydrogenase